MGLVFGTLVSGPIAVGPVFWWSNSATRPAPYQPSHIKNSLMTSIYDAAHEIIRTKPDHTDFLSETLGHYSAKSRMTLIRSDFPSKPMPGSSGISDVAVFDLRPRPGSRRTAGKDPDSSRCRQGRDPAAMLSDIWWPPCGMQRDGDQPQLVQDIQRAQVFHEPVGKGAVELQPIAVGPHAAVTEQVAGILMREKVFAGRHRARVELGHRGLKR